MNLTLSRLEISQFREIIFRFYDAYSSKGGPIRVPRPVFTLHTEIETPNIWHHMICDVNGRILTYSFKNVRSTTFA